MSFITTSGLPQVDRAILVQASYDDFATIAFYWGDSTIQSASTGVVYEGRITSVGDITRSLGVDRLATSASASLELDNTDGELDELMTGDAFAGLRLRVFLTIWKNTDTTPTFDDKLLGEFTMQSPAQERGGRITLQLGDDMMTRIGSGLQLPTFRDWALVGDATNNPLINDSGISLLGAVGFAETVSLDTPIQLAFGEDWLQALPHVLCPFNSNYTFEVILPLYSTVDTSAVDQSLVDRVRVDWFSIDADEARVGAVQEWRDIPREIPDGETSFSSGGWGTPVWLVEKSPTITKNGTDFQIVYLRVKTHLGIGWPRSSGAGQGSTSVLAAQMAQYGKFAAQGGYRADLIEAMDDGAPNIGAYYKTVASRVIRWYVDAAPKSQVTSPPGIGEAAHAVDIATDLVSSYLPGIVDATTAARVKQGNPNAAATGVVHPWTERQNYTPSPGVPNTLRQVMSKLAQSSDIDFFINWDGELAFASDVWAWLALGGDAALDALASYDEGDVSDLERWIPSEGDRWAPFNRVYFDDAKDYPPEQLDVPFQGPYDLRNIDGIISPDTRLLEATLPQGWRPYRQMKDTPLDYRQVDGSPRWRIRFKTHLLFLQHDLGDYFRLTWRRDSTSPALYEGTVFQVEALAFSAADNSVTVEAIWRDDARTTRQYLLDDDAYFLDGDIDNSTSNATTYAVSTDIWVTTPDDNELSKVDVGDLFLNTDDTSTEPGYWRIVQVDTSGGAPGGSAAVKLEPHSDGTIPAAGLTLAASKWFIYKTALTLTGLAHHPNGTRVYGCVTNISGELSDASIGNKLLNG